MIEDFIDAIRNFARTKTRTFLSLLGVIIGVASVIVITSLGESSTREMKDTFGSAGLDVVNISEGGFMRRNRDAISLKFDESFRNELFDSIEHIKKIWYKNSTSFSVSYGETTVTSQTSAIETGYLEMYGLELDYGEYFSVTDEYSGAQKMIIGSEVASTLFPDGNPVGKNVLVVTNKVPFSFQVSGVLKEQSSGFEDSTTGIYIPRGFYSKKITPSPSANTVIVQAEDLKYCTNLVTEITSFIEEKAGMEGVARVSSMQTMIEQMNEITGIMSLMLSGIAAISLIVGGIGIMNIMIVTVTERRQEIGIRKALGATPFAICRQFLVESAGITLLGGVLGVILGIITSFAVQYIKGQVFALQTGSIITAFLFSVFVGVFFGLSPAIKASKLDPVEALSS